MKLTGRVVMFNYLLELDAHDVKVLAGIMATVVHNNEARSVAANISAVSEDEVSRVAGKMKGLLDTAQEQIDVTRSMFAAGRDDRRSAFRGIDIPAVKGPEEVPAPRG